MRKQFTAVIVLGVLAIGAVMLWQTTSGNASTPKAGAAVASGKLAFLELGSVGCKPCDAMVPVLDAVRRDYGDRVEVTFHDVRKNPAVGKQWGVILIPTQVFLDVSGKEYFRHEGYLALEEVVKALKQGGLR